MNQQKITWNFETQSHPSKMKIKSLERSVKSQQCLLGISSLETYRSL